MNSGPTDPLIGKTLDQRYVVRSRIARGGMAMVYVGEDLRLHRRVAVKAMHPHLADDEKFTRRFEQEARSSAGLGHPNVVNVFDQGEADGVPYLVMEYLPGITLRELLRQQRQLSTEQATEIAEAVLSGLAAAHEAGIVHRDLKPENVLLADDGRIKIADFGLARAVSANTTTGQALLGTIAYLSPELVTRGIADERTDLYAFGIMLFEMLTGKQPYTGEQPMQIAYQHAHSDVPAPSSLAPEVTPELDQLVRWCTQRDPDLRPADARGALDYLQALRLGGPLAATSVLPLTAVQGTITPSTAVLSDIDQQALQASVAEPAQPATAASAAAAAVEDRAGGVAVDRAQRLAKRRRSRGRWIAAIVTLLVAAAAGAGLWWGQGPGSLIAVPEIAGAEMAQAQQRLEADGFVVEPFECPSLEVPPGLAARTEPEAGQRIERGGVVRLCQSTGPQLLEVPQLVGLTEQQAEQAIKQKDFTFGSVIERRFDSGEKGRVILAVDANGAGIGSTYPQRGRIDLIVSAGSLPDVSGATVEAATNALRDAGLTVDPARSTEAFSETIEKGRVIRIVGGSDPLSVGGSVGLELSKGPELFEVPDVVGMRLSDAIDALGKAGFKVTHNVPELLYSLARVTDMKPAAGEKLPAGTVIHLGTRINL